MRTTELLARLRERDVRLWIEGDRLRCSAPAGGLTAELKTALAQRKDEIVSLLRHAEALKGGWSSIIPLKSDGGRPPMFAVPGHNGDVFCYRALARHLDPDQPLLGLQPPGLDGSEPIRSIEELARHQVRQIRRYQPRGPYFIAGYCAGGTVAFEIARQLFELGEPVEVLVLFGASFPPLYRSRPQAAFWARSLAARAQRHTRALLSGSWDGRAQYLRTKIRAFREERSARTEELHNPVLRHRRRVEQATIAAIRSYRMRPFPGRVELFLASEADRQRGGLPHQWRAYAASLHEQVGTDDCDGDVMLKEPHVARVARGLSTALQTPSRDAAVPAYRCRTHYSGSRAARPVLSWPRRFAKRWVEFVLERMDRVHLFEFNDQRWLPRFMKEWMTSILRICHETTEDGCLWAPKVLELINRYGRAEIVDLCSGAGGPVLTMARVLEHQHGIRPRLTLTDISPNLHAARDINEEGGDRLYLTRSVNATDVPKDIHGIRTVFSGLHHLKPDLAFRLLKDAFDGRRYIFVGETTKRHHTAIRVYAQAPLHCFRMTARIDPTIMQRFFTFVVPILPCMLGWDNVVSCLRTYSQRELLAFLGRLQSEDYRWELGELWNTSLGTPYPYLLGYPVSPSEGRRGEEAVAESRRPGH